MKLMALCRSSICGTWNTSKERWIFKVHLRTGDGKDGIRNIGPAGWVVVWPKSLFIRTVQPLFTQERLVVFGWGKQRPNVVPYFENGCGFGRRHCYWPEASGYHLCRNRWCESSQSKRAVKVSRNLYDGNTKLLGLEETRTITASSSTQKIQMKYLWVLLVLLGAKDRAVFSNRPTAVRSQPIKISTPRQVLAPWIQATQSAWIAAMWEYRRWPRPLRAVFIVRIVHHPRWWWKLEEDDRYERSSKGDLGRGSSHLTIEPEQSICPDWDRWERLYASSNGGAKWYKVSEDEQTGNRPFYADLRVDPQNEDRIYRCGYVRGDDGGKSWRPSRCIARIHPDHHAMWIDPVNPSHVIEGNDGGMNISYDHGEIWLWELAASAVLPHQWWSSAAMSTAVCKTTVHGWAQRTVWCRFVFATKSGASCFETALM